MPSVYRLHLHTHHIVSPRKIAVLRKAAVEHAVSAVLKTRGSPGIMLAEASSEAEIKAWHRTARELRYKDMRFVTRQELEGERTLCGGKPGLLTVGTLKDLDAELDKAGNGWREWWRAGMGYS